MRPHIGYAVSHDPHCRCRGLPITARLEVTPWAIESYYRCEWKRKIQCVSLTTLARRRWTELRGGFPGSRRWIAIDLLGRPRNNLSGRSPEDVRYGRSRESKSCKSEARVRQRYVWLPYRPRLP